MKKKFKLIPFIIFSLLFIEAIPFVEEKSQNSFNTIENKVMEDCDFVQNGIKMEYLSQSTFKDEQSRLLMELKKNIKDDIQLNKNKIIYKDLEKEITVNIWEENSKTKVEIVYLNNKNTKTSADLKKELVKFQNNKSIQVRYFTFIKGKIKISDENYVQELLKNYIKEGTLESLDIHNGYVAKAKLRDNQRVNVGNVKYDTGEYIVVGTPMIFITY